MRINIRFIRASQFLKQFKLDVKHKFEKKYIISNALFRLININHNKKCFNSKYSKLNALYEIFCSLITIFAKFHKRLIENYIIDR